MIFFFNSNIITNISKCKIKSTFNSNLQQKTKISEKNKIKIIHTQKYNERAFFFFENKEKVNSRGEEEKNKNKNKLIN